MTRQLSLNGVRRLAAAASLILGGALVGSLAVPAAGAPALQRVEWDPEGAGQPKVTLQPEAGQEGVIGGLVDSVLANGKKHFVSPKAAGGWVVVQAVVETPGVDFSDAFQWACNGGQAVAGARDKWQFPRGNADKYVAKVVRKGGGAEAARMYVWVVWADAGEVEWGFGTGITESGAQVPLNDGTTSPDGKVLSVPFWSNFTVQPGAIAQDADRPDFDGIPEGIPGGEQRHFLQNAPLSLGATTRWDVSRQIRVKVLNPNLIPWGKLLRLPTGGREWDGQPAIETIPEDYPGDPVVGNDDWSTADEDNTPPALRQHDQPNQQMGDTAGNVGDTFEVRWHFRDFVRLQIGAKWYSVSDFVPWRVHFRFRKDVAGWVNNNSVKAADNEGW